jgi:hypothetical protein
MAQLTSHPFDARDGDPHHKSRNMMTARLLEWRSLLRTFLMFGMPIRIANLVICQLPGAVSITVEASIRHYAVHVLMWSNGHGSKWRLNTTYHCFDALRDDIFSTATNKLAKRGHHGFCLTRHCCYPTDI